MLNADAIFSGLAQLPVFRMKYKEPRITSGIFFIDPAAAVCESIVNQNKLQLTERLVSQALQAFSQKLLTVIYSKYDTDHEYLSFLSL